MQIFIRADVQWDNPNDPIDENTKWSVYVDNKKYGTFDSYYQARIYEDAFHRLCSFHPPAISSVKAQELVYNYDNYEEYRDLCDI